MENSSNSSHPDEQYKPGGMDAVVKKVETTTSSSNSIIRLRFYDMLLRLLGFGSTLVAALVVGFDKESKIVSITFLDTLPPLHFHATADWHYVSSSRYFLVTNAIASSYAAVSLIYTMAVSKGGRLSNDSISNMVLILLDLIVMALLFSADGAAGGVGIIAQDGNSHMEWRKICNFFEGYCHHFAASFTLSLLGSFVFLWLVVHSVFNLYSNTD